MDAQDRTTGSPGGRGENLDEYSNDPFATGYTGADTTSQPPTTQVPAQPTTRQPAQQSYQAADQNAYQGAAHQQGAPDPFAAGQAEPFAAPADTTARHARVDYSAPQAGGGSTVPPIPGQEPGLATTPEPSPKKSGGAKSLILGLVGGVVGAGLLTGALLATGVIGKSSTALSSGTSQSVTITPSDEDTSTANAVAAKALPSVCTVNVSSSSSSGLGSGVIYDTEGNIITNYHVIDGADSVSVTIDGTTYDATVVGSDSSSDIAVLKVDLNGASVTPIEIGDSSSVQVGDWVMSVGSPFGLEQSVSQGIVSALTRNELLTSSSGNTLYTNLIQVDCSINPGNSGGALVDSEGKLIGICTLYTSSTESFAGIGFAIPGNYAVKLAQKIIAGETVTHAHIGLSMQTVNESNAKANKLSVTSGAYVADVTENGPAANAGIQKGDIIIGMDGSAITSADGVILAVRSHEIGDTVKVTVMRGTEEKTFDVTLDDDEELQKQQSVTSDINSYLNNNTDSDSTVDLYDLFNQFMQRQNGGSGGNGYGNGYGNNGYGYGYGN